MKRRYPSIDAAAEMVGTVILIAILVTAVALVALLLFSQPAPEKLPAVAVSISNQTKIIEIRHEGGNMLTFDEMEIQIDHELVPYGGYTCINCGSDWSVGDVIRIDLSSDPRYEFAMPNKVDIIYKKGDQPQQILTTRYLGTMTPTLTPFTPYPTTQVTIDPTRPPVVEFSGTPVSGPAPLTVAFTDLSTNGPSSWIWNFGDSTTSTEQNPTHQYTSVGTYTVVLMAQNSAGSGTLTKAGYISVTDLSPITDFTNLTPRIGNAPLTVEFRDTSGRSPFAWNWSFGDGAFSEDQDPTHTYPTDGTYTVSLQATNSGGSNTTEKTAFVTVYPVSTTKKLINLNAGKYGYLKTGGAFQFRVTGDWSYVQLASTPRINLVRNDVVRIVLTEDSTGQIDITNQITTFSILNVRLFVNGVDRGVGTISQIYISAFDSTDSTLEIDVPSSSAGTYFNVDGTTLINWWPHDAQRIQVFRLYPSDEATPRMRFTSSTTTVYYIGGAMDYLLTPPGAVAPVAGFSGTPLSGNAPLTVIFTDASTNSPTSWLWDFGDGFTSTVQSPSHRFNTSGTYTVSLTASNAAGSDIETKTNYITVNVVRPVAEFSGTPRSGVEPLTVTFTDLSTNSPTSWLWDFGDGATSTLQNPTHQYTTDGRYRVRLTTTNSAGSDTESKNNYIDVDTFTADFSYTYEDVAIIPPFWYAYSVDFTGTSNGSPVSWNWNFDGGSGSTTIQNPQDVFYLFGGNYDVSLTVTNSVGTTATVTKRVRLT